MWLNLSLIPHQDTNGQSILMMFDGNEGSIRAGGLRCDLLVGIWCVPCKPLSNCVAFEQCDRILHPKSIYCCGSIVRNVKIHEL